MSMAQSPHGPDCRIWQIDLDATPEPRSLAALSDAEWERAGRFVFRRDRDRFVAAHAALRSALSAHTGVEAAELEFGFNAFGKPSLVHHTGVYFNLSHSQSRALVAVHTRCEVGVDIELQRTMPDADDLAASYFTADEIRSLSCLEPEARERAFLVCWTRKEACLKALGVGLSLDLRTIDVGTSEIEERPVHCRVDGRTRSLSVSSIALPGHAVAAIALDTSQLASPIASTKLVDVEILQ